MGNKLLEESTTGIRGRQHDKALLILFGLFLFLLLLELGMRFSGIVLLSLQEHRNQFSANKISQYRIMCIGESTTAESYPSQLEEILNTFGKGIKFSVINKGVGGTSTAQILHELEDNLNKYNPNMVIAMMGINDQGIHMPAESNISKETSFYEQLKIYKLARFIKFRITRKIEEISLFCLNSTRRSNVDYINSAIIYIEQGAFSQAEAILKKVLKRNSNDDRAHRELGMVYIHLGDRYFSLAERHLSKAIEIAPFDSEAHCRLGILFRYQQEYLKSEIFLKKAIEFNPGNGGAYIQLGTTYFEQGEFIQAEAIMKKAIEINPYDSGGYVGLAEFYISMGDYFQAYNILNKASEWATSDSKLLALLATTCRSLGKDQFAAEFLEKALKLSGYYKAITIRNYHRLKDILDGRKIKLVCVQYPTRNLKPLKTIFGKEDDIVFIDNERIFKEAIKKSRYSEYFKDAFAGDFGHCTFKGYRLLAENIASVVLAEVFR